VLTTLLRAEWLAADRPGGEGDDLREDARHDVELLIDRYSAGGTRPLRPLVAALAEYGADAWMAVSRLTGDDPAAAQCAADRYRDSPPKDSAVSTSGVVGQRVYDRWTTTAREGAPPMTDYPPQDEAHFPAGRYVLTYTDDLPQGVVVFLERWEGGRPVVRGATGDTWPLALPAVRMASSHATFAQGQAARLAVCREEHMTVGQLRNRVAAYERELPWAPPADDVEAHRAWYARTADTRAAAERAAAELNSRGWVDGPKVTAEEWLQAAEARRGRG
jgi:hypothetical protein